MSNLTNIATYFKTNWEDYTVKDQHSYSMEIDINSVSASSEIKLVTLSMTRYSGYSGRGYGVGTASRGITEQEAYDIWNDDFQKHQRVYIRQLQAFNITSIPQSVYDGMLLYYIINGNLLTVEADEGMYELREFIVKKDWDTVASMIKRSNFNRNFCSRAATVLRLADYGRYKERSWYRQKGIYEMRDKNEIGVFNTEQLTRARFAYYAETLQFLPNTPDGLKRDIAKRYEETLVFQNEVYNGVDTVFTLQKSPSMDPVEKLKVEVNGTALQHYFDFTVNENKLTITKQMQTNDILRFTIKI